MHDIQLISHETNWWVLNGKVRQGPYYNLKLASRIALASRRKSQRVMVFNTRGDAIMYWPNELESVVSTPDDTEITRQALR